MSIPFHLAGLVLTMAALLAGCSKASTFKELRDFDAALALEPEVDWSKVKRATVPDAQYRVGEGDVLKVNMPEVLASVGLRQVRNELREHFCRIDTNGEAIFPLIGKQKVGGLTQIEIEALLTSAYHPKYFATPISVVVDLESFQTYPVRVFGAVAEPGIVQLKRNEMTLITAVAKAGGFLEEGAAGVHILSNESGTKKPVVLPITGQTIDFNDIAIGKNDQLKVVKLVPRRISVIGLVKEPGVFEYAPNDEIFLGEAIGMAGGVDDIAAPPYATVYRKAPNGGVVSATFDIRKSFLSDQGQLLKPGDIVALEPTVGAMARILITTMVRIGVSRATFD